MKEQRLEILQKVANGKLTPEEAHTELLGLSIASVSLPSTEEIEKVARARFKGRKHVMWKVGIFKAGANWMKSIAYGCSDVVGNKEFVGNVSHRFWSVVEKRGQVYHELKSYKTKQDAVNLLIKLKSESLTDYQLVSISNEF